MKDSSMLNEPIEHQWRRPTLVVAFVFTFVLTLLIAGGIAYVISAVIPHYEGIFKDFKVNLPDSTRYLLMFARGFNAYYGWAFLPLLPLAVALAVWQLSRKSSDPAIPLIYTLLFALIELMFTVVCSAFVNYALSAPMIELLRSISGSPRGY
jgi:type II secretory pathway component PulF